MSHQNRLSGVLAADGIDVTVAKVGLVFGTVLLGLSLLARDVFLVVIPISTVTACGIYLALGNRHISHVSVPTLSGNVAGFLPSFVVGGLAAFVVLVWLAGQRTLLAYLLAGGIGSLILGQILLLDDDRLDPGTILSQILLAAIVIRLTGLFVTPGYVGVDIWEHLSVMVQGIVDSGSLSAISGNKHVMAPIYHVFAAVSTLVFGSVRTGVYLTLGLAIPMAALLVYGTSKQFVPARWALLATGMFAFADEFVRWGMHIIPTSLGLVFFTVVVYCVTRLFAAGAERRIVALLGLASFAVVFTHQVSTAIMLLFLAIATFVALVFTFSSRLPSSFGSPRMAVVLALVFVGNVVVTIVTWANTPFTGPEPFLWNRIDVISSAFSEAGFLDLAGGSGGGSTATASQTLLETLIPYLDVLGFTLMLFATVVGGLAMLGWNEFSDMAYTHILAMGTMFVGVFGLSIFGIRVFLPGRWMVFLYVPMVVIASVGLYYFYQRGSRRVILAVFVLFALAYPGAMMIADGATKDSPAFPDHQVRYAYNQEEIGAVETISAIRPASVAAPLTSDHPYWTFFEGYGSYEGSTLAVNESGPATSAAVVSREYQLRGPASFAVPGTNRTARHSRPLGPSTICTTDRNVVYANDDVQLCLASAVGTEAGS
jgi:hypothetical protein